MSDDATLPPKDWPKVEDPKLLERIIDIIAKDGAVDRARIAPEATLESLGLASIDVVTILMSVEEELNTYLPMDTKLSSARNLSEFISSIASAVQAHKPPEPSQTV